MTIKFDVTKEHLTRAIENYNRLQTDACTECLLAEALKDINPRVHVSVGFYTATIDQVNYQLNTLAQALIEKFMLGQYSQINLPQEVEMETF